MEGLSRVVAKVSLDSDTPAEVVDKVIELVDELLGNRKNLLEGLKHKLVTYDEVGGAIIGHLHTYRDGYLVKNSYLLKNIKGAVVECLMQNT